MSTAAVTERPASVKEASELLRELGGAGRRVRVRGGDTKLGWTPGAGKFEVVLQTGGLDRVLEHNAGDFTAVLETGVPLAAAQERFAAHGQMLALDPPLLDGRATLGGVLASADSGPLRHRYGSVRDLVLGVTVVLSDGTVAKSGGRVIKNVAGYDLGKLFAGSRGTLGLIARVAVRLHPLPRRTATVTAASADAARLAGAAARLAGLPLEADCLDIAWSDGQGELLVRFSGATASERAAQALHRAGELGLEDPRCTEEDDELWERQRAAQRRPDGAVVKVAHVITDLEAVLRAADRARARVVSRAGLGVSWLALAGDGDDLAARIAVLRQQLAETSPTVLDGAHLVSDPRPAPVAGALAVMERLKARFDPARIFPEGV
ncbi:MAG TPA: FAD-binding oxidoreductase [Solirubrobacteraceae bacterium]|nr:FAD-binding oxidoreductase [Solirubrobacteraceae bacterium]